MKIHESKVKINQKRKTKKGTGSMIFTAMFFQAKEIPK